MKKDGSVCFGVDRCRPNAVTVRDSYPSPRIDECIDSREVSRIFSTLDANSGYRQIVMDKEMSKGRRS